MENFSGGVFPDPFRQHYFPRRDRISLSNPKGVVQMTVDSYLHREGRRLERMGADPRLRRIGRVLGWFAGGFLLSAASLLQSPMPLVMGFAAAIAGWRGLLLGLGGALGYRFYWGTAGEMGFCWILGGLITGLCLGKSRIRRDSPALIPALCGLIPAATGLGFQLMGREIGTMAYLLQVGLGAGSAAVFDRLVRGRDKAALWAAEGMTVLALARTGPLLWMNPGCVAAGILGVSAPFPAAVLAGLALDLAGLCPVPMTAALSALCVVRMIPGIPRWALRLLPGPMYLLVMVIGGKWDLSPLPGLVAGGIISAFLPGMPDMARRRGPMGRVRLRLELAGQVLAQSRILLMESEDPPVDEEALLMRTRERACGGCPNRKHCRIPDRIPKELLHRPLTENTSLPFSCRKPGRMVLEIRRSQEQYRLLRADRERRREYRGAVNQQYLFLSEYLMELAKDLSRRPGGGRSRFTPEVAWASRSREAENGDKFRHFSGPGGSYYLLLCDGMGTGYAAAQEGRTAANLLRKLLTGGYPPRHALESLNSLLILRGRAGAVTVDLVELRLDTGEAVLYKWGAAPSWVARGGGLERIGTGGPPPGLGLTREMEKARRLFLGRGEALILVSDGLDGEKFQSRAAIPPKAAAGELAACILEAGAAEPADDATVAVVRLHRSGSVDIISPTS